MPRKPQITVVSMSEAHIPALADIEKACFSTPWSVQALREELEVPSAIFLVALVDGNVAGYMGMQVTYDIAYVCNIAVAPVFRRMGVASALLAAQTDVCRRRDIGELSLEVRRSNTAARALYEKSGFCRVGTRPRFYSHPPEDAEIYTLRLPSQPKGTV